MNVNTPDKSLSQPHISSSHEEFRFDEARKTSKIDDTNMPLTDINESLEKHLSFLLL